MSVFFRDHLKTINDWTSVLTAFRSYCRLDRFPFADYGCYTILVLLNAFNVGSKLQETTNLFCRGKQFMCRNMNCFFI
jgi:hypothetical protein